jgi:large-conductance mechanosensitive channel
MGKWLAGTWEGTATKAIIGAALGALLSWLVTANVHPLIMAIGAAAIPVAINALNSADSRYGKGAQPHPDDVATAHEFEIEGEQ